MKESEADNEPAPNEDSGEVEMELRRPLGGAVLQGAIVITLTILLVLLVGYGIWRLFKVLVR